MNIILTVLKTIVGCISAIILIALSIVLSVIPFVVFIAGIILCAFFIFELWKFVF